MNNFYASTEKSRSGKKVGTFGDFASEGEFVYVR